METDMYTPMDKIIQICTGGYDNNWLFALTDDGKIYMKDINSTNSFIEMEK